AELAVQAIVGVLADRARVEHDDLGVGGLLGRNVAIRREETGDPLGVVFVHLAPEGAQQETAGHEPECSEPGPAAPGGYGVNVVVVVVAATLRRAPNNPPTKQRSEPAPHSHTPRSTTCSPAPERSSWMRNRTTPTIPTAPATLVNAPVRSDRPATATRATTIMAKPSEAREPEPARWVVQSTRNG